MTNKINLLLLLFVAILNNSLQAEGKKKNYFTCTIPVVIYKKNEAGAFVKQGTENIPIYYWQKSSTEPCSCSSKSSKLQNMAINYLLKKGLKINGQFSVKTPSCASHVKQPRDKDNILKEDPLAETDGRIFDQIDADPSITLTPMMPS